MWLVVVLTVIFGWGLAFLVGRTSVRALGPLLLFKTVLGHLSCLQVDLYSNVPSLLRDFGIFVRYPFQNLRGLSSAGGPCRGVRHAVLHRVESAVRSMVAEASMGAHSSFDSGGGHGAFLNPSFLTVCRPVFIFR